MDAESSRLNKFIALHAGISRRAADELIESGRVRIDGVVARLGARTTSNAMITLDGKSLMPHMAHRYILFHKPRGYVCSRKQQGSAETIFALLPDELQHLNPVGRLDRDTSGLLLLTNDGELAFQMTHPKFHKIKLYEATLDHPLAPLHQQMISDRGVSLEDGQSKLGLERLDDTRTTWQITMSEGRNRQIRRTFASLGYTVTELHRDQFGPYQLKKLPEGSFQEIKSDGTIIERRQ